MTAVETPARKRAAKKKEEEDAAAQAAAARAAWPFEFEILALDRLQVDAGYQRPLTGFWITIRDSFDPALVGTLIVSRRKNGDETIIDGQTRWKAMTDIGITHGPCLVYLGLTRAQEAELFAALQRQRRAMRVYHRFRAELVAKDPQAVGIAKIATDAGFELGVEELKNTLQSITALEAAYKVDPDHLAEVLAVIRDAWATPVEGTELVDKDGYLVPFTIDSDAVTSQVIKGVSMFIREQERLDPQRLRDRLRDVTPRLLMNKAAQIRDTQGSGTGAAGAIRQAIMNEYMRKKR